MDKVIGRSVFRIRGAVSANNYVEFEHLNLVGPIVYVQMCLQNPVIATFHLEVVTSANVSLRLSVSTLYDGDAPKFLGRSLRYGAIVDGNLHLSLSDFRCLILLDGW